MIKTKKIMGAICSEAHRAAMEGMLPAGSPIACSDNPDVRQILETMSKQLVDVVVVDDAGLPYKEYSEPDLLAFPASQTGEHRTRLVFVPTESRVPGDRFMAQLVSVGVYDIADPHTSTLEADIQSMVERPRGFADATAWYDMDAAAAAADGAAKRAKQKNKESRSGLFGLFGGRKKDREAQRDDTPAEQARKLETPPAAQPPEEGRLAAPRQPESQAQPAAEAAEVLKKMAESGEASESAIEWLMSAAQQAQRPSEPGRKPRNEVDAAAAMEAMASSGEASESAVRWLRTDPPAQDQRPVAGAERFVDPKAELAKAAMRSASAASAVEWLSAEEEPDPIALKIAAKVAADKAAHPDAPASPIAPESAIRETTPPEPDAEPETPREASDGRDSGLSEIARHNDAQPETTPEAVPEAAGAAHVAECAPTPEEPSAAPAPEPAPAPESPAVNTSEKAGEESPGRASDPARHYDAQSGKPAKKRKDWSHRRRALIAVASPIDPCAASRVAFGIACWTSRRSSELGTSLKFEDKSVYDNVKGLLGAAGPGQLPRNLDFDLIGSTHADPEYVVCDCGLVIPGDGGNPAGEGEWKSADIRIMAVPGDPWEVYRARKAVEAMPDRGKTDCIWIFLGAPAGSVAPFVLGAANTEKAVKESRCYTVPRGDGGWWTGTFPDYKPILGHLFDKKRVPASRQGLPDSMMWGALVSPDGKQHTDVMPLGSEWGSLRAAHPDWYAIENAFADSVRNSVKQKSASLRKREERKAAKANARKADAAAKARKAAKEAAAAADGPDAR